MNVSVDRDVADKEQFDATRVTNADPGFKYRLLNVNSHNMARKQFKGWVPVTDGKEKLALDMATPIKVGAPLDSTRGFADVILAKMPIEEHEARIAKPVREAQKHRSGAIERQYRQTVASGFSEAEGTGAYSGEMTQSQFDAVPTKGK